MGGFPVGLPANHPKKGTNKYTLVLGTFISWSKTRHFGGPGRARLTAPLAAWLMDAARVGFRIGKGAASGRDWPRGPPRCPTSHLFGGRVPLLNRPPVVLFYQFFWGRVPLPLLK